MEQIQLQLRQLEGYFLYFFFIINEIIDSINEIIRKTGGAKNIGNIRFSLIPEAGLS